MQRHSKNNVHSFTHKQYSMNHLYHLLSTKRNVCLLSENGTSYWTAVVFLRCKTNFPSSRKTLLEVASRCAQWHEIEFLAAGGRLNWRAAAINEMASASRAQDTTLVLLDRYQVRLPDIYSC